MTRRQALTAIGVAGGGGEVVGALAALDLLDDGGSDPFRPGRYLNAGPARIAQHPHDPRLLP